MKLELSVSESEISSVKGVLEWIENRESFVSRVRKFESDAMRTHIGLLVAHGERDEINDDLVVFNCEHLLRAIKYIEASPITESSLVVFILDILHVYAHFGVWKENDWQALEAMSISALHEQKEVPIEICLRLYSRLSGIVRISQQFLEALVEFTHKVDPNSKLSIESFIVLEKIVQESPEKGAETATVIQNMIAKCSKSKTVCDNCLAISAHFIDHLVRNSSTDFPSGFLQEGIISSVTGHRKKANYILKKFVKHSLEQKRVENLVDVGAKYDSIEEVESVWETFFMALESLIEIQAHLITSTLSQYLEQIVEFIPLCWVKSIFVLTLHQNSISVVKYVINFLIENKVNFDGEPKLSNSFFSALNVTGLYVEDEYGFAEKLGTFLGDDLRAKTSFIAAIQWKKVPAFVLLSAWLRAMKQSSSRPSEVDAVSFIASCVKVLASSSDEITDLDEIITEALRLTDAKRVDVVKLLEIYELVPSQNILSAMAKQLTPAEFSTIILTATIPAHIKADYLRKAYPDAGHVLDQLDDLFEEQCALFGPYHFDFNYIVFDTTLREKPLFEAVSLFKLRSYGILLEHQQSKPIFMAVFKMLYTITMKYMPAYRERNHPEWAETYTALYEMFEYLLKKVYGGDSEVLRLDKASESQLSDWIAVLKGEFAASTNLFSSPEEILSNIVAAVCYEDFDLNLVSFEGHFDEIFHLTCSPFQTHLKTHHDLKGAQMLLDAFMQKSHSNEKHRAAMIKK